MAREPALGIVPLRRIVGQVSAAVEHFTRAKGVPARCMTALGHKQISRDVRVTSALPPIADIRRMSRQVRYVPQADVHSAVARFEGRAKR